MQNYNLHPMFLEIQDDLLSAWLVSLLLCQWVLMWNAPMCLCKGASNGHRNFYNNEHKSISICTWIWEVLLKHYTEKLLLATFCRFGVTKLWQRTLKWYLPWYQGIPSCYCCGINLKDGRNIMSMWDRNQMIDSTVSTQLCALGIFGLVLVHLKQ